MRAVVIGASGGIGAAVCADLRARGAEVVPLSRSREGLDVTDEVSVARVLGAVSGEMDLVFVATGALDLDLGSARVGGGARVGPEKALRALSAEAMAASFAVNTIGPALVLKHSLRLMPRGRRAVFACLSARVGSIGDNRLGGWYSYRTAKAALNQMVRTASVEVARTHPQAVLCALHPGTVETGLTAPHAGGHPKVTPAVSAAHLLGVIDGLSPADSGGFFDWAGAVVPW